MNIAIQGIRGSYHHIVAEDYFGKDNVFSECMTFGEMPDLVLEGKVAVAVMLLKIPLRVLFCRTMP